MIKVGDWVTVAIEHPELKMLRVKGELKSATKQGVVIVSDDEETWLFPWRIIIYITKSAEQD